MTALPNPVAPGCDLYDDEIVWRPFAGIENLELSLFDLDEERGVVDLIVRFAPNKTVTMHNHVAPTNMFIVQGELRIYEADGSVREARPAGRYYRGRKDDVHSEGGGPDGAVVYYSLRYTRGDDLLEIMDGEGAVTARLGIGEMRAAWAEQQAGR